ncbi:lipopolysaccharide biosynthesis protein [Pseudomonas sp. MAFF212428]|uniref:Lipopolysaccharide biosynthesis protein n=1 Tax=Pseudomonas brassicae TaxID=2708063 RepID=A0A6B3NRZ8_9PSED|nr:lipopolysaccharide biosynthesis protein [Pseudomonas brassicae]NER58959.1 lipopolysaccharide biosynthesis protein [Pseudomonas brassicae]NER63040.1 lipopolysaccharide biosynthesis protein [Pseudomonas brassicae]
MEAVLSDGPGLHGSVKNFASCRNIAQGPVIIVASGSSARDFPIEQFADVPMITMNGAISMFADTDIDPYFYVCSDTHFSVQQPALYALAMRRSKRVALWQAEVEPAAGEMYLLKKANDLPLLGSIFKREPHHARSWALWNKRARSIGFSKDMQHGYFDARTVAYLALQVAYHVGFTKVFLVGVDLNQSVGRFYEHNHAIKSPCGLDQHYERRILPSMKLMAKRVMGERFAVYNVSQASRIPRSLIPKVTVEQVRAMLDQG